MNDLINVEMFEKPKLKDPIMLCGLPGIGSIGKITADYLAIELKAKLFCRVYSNTFPPQVLISGQESEQMKNDFYYKKDSNLIILCGNAQPMDCFGMYQVGDEIIKIAKKLGVNTIITLASYVSGYQGNKPRVFRAATDPKLIEDLNGLGVIKMHSGSISGLNGLLLGLCKLNNMDGMCLLGETSGREISDLRAARALLKILTKKLNIEINLEGIEQANLIKEDIIKKAWVTQKPKEKDDEGYLVQYG